MSTKRIYIYVCIPAYIYIYIYIYIYTHTHTHIQYHRQRNIDRNMERLNISKDLYIYSVCMSCINI